MTRVCDTYMYIDVFMLEFVLLSFELIPAVIPRQRTKDIGRKQLQYRFSQCYTFMIYLASKLIYVIMLIVQCARCSAICINAWTRCV